MLTRAQRNLLHHLASFPDALVDAWDVPRDLSLPGLSDAMGIVRSGLNAPLKALESSGFVTKRMAHVIGGGSRRRHVHHITPAGRAWLEGNPTGAEPSPTRRSEPEAPLVAVVPGQEGDAVPWQRVVGRGQAMDAVVEHLSSGGAVHVHGMSGIGKTAFGQALRHRTEGSRWVACDAFTDAQAVVRGWVGGSQEAPLDRAALLDAALALGGTLYIDDLHLVDPRHLPGVVDLLNGIVDGGGRLVTLAKPPLDVDLAGEVHVLGPLEPEVAASLLPEHLEGTERMAIARALGGHPMALHLHQVGDALPEEGEPVQAYVSQAVLGGLDAEVHRALDALVLFPRPLPVEHVPHEDAIGPLDDHALLRWNANSNRLEIQHVVRNVRRAMLTPEVLQRLHAEAAEHWAARSSSEEFEVLRLYHELAAGQRPEDLTERVNALMAGQHGPLAVVLAGALQHDEADEPLNALAGHVALHRMELDNVRQHLDRLAPGARRRRLAHGLAVAEGDETLAASLVDEAREDDALEASRLMLASAVQAVEDRLFDGNLEASPGAVSALLDRIVLPARPEQRTPLTVGMALVRHAMALRQGGLNEAGAVRDALAGVSHDDDPTVQWLAVREAMASNELVGDTLVQRLSDVAARQPTPLHAALLTLAGAEHAMVSGDRATAASLHERLPLPSTLPSLGQTAQRYAARWWYLKAHLQPEERRRCLQESAALFRRAGCHRAARQAVARLHRSL